MTTDTKARKITINVYALLIQACLQAYMIQSKIILTHVNV